MNSSTVFKRTLIFGSLLALSIAVVGSILGYVAVGSSGVVSALIGTGIALVFMGITAASILVANRFDMVAFFAIVMGAWLLKFVVFLVLVFVLKEQAWIEPVVLFLNLIVAVVGTLVVDVIVVAKSRMPYVSDVSLPGEPQSDDEGR